MDLMPETESADARWNCAGALRGGRLVEQRFPFRKPALGRARAAAVLRGDSVQFEHPTLKAPLMVPIPDVAGVVRVASTEPTGSVLRRTARVVHFPADGLKPPNVAMVFRRPIAVARFKFGANHSIGITGRERRKGVALDAMLVTVEDPDGLVSAMSYHGVPVVETVGGALRDVIGEATGQELVTRRLEIDAARSKARIRLLGFGALFTGLVALRLAFASSCTCHRPSTAKVLGLLASSFVWATVLAWVLSAAWTRGVERRELHDVSAVQHIGAVLLGLVAIAVVPALIAWWLASELGTPPTLAYGLVAGVPGGIWSAFVIVRTRPPLETNAITQPSHDTAA